jgi:hypothetical protein
MKTHASLALLRRAAFAISCLGACATSSLAGPLGDSAVGTTTTLGNSLNPSPGRGETRDKEWPIAKHTPTGQMFRLPLGLSDLTKAASGWEYSGQIEFGYLGGDADEENSRFRMYSDVDEGAYLNNFKLEMRNPDGHSVEFTGGAAGRRDQYYGVQVGRINAWKVKVFYTEIPHVFTHRYKSIWNGIGTANLTLVPGLTPGGTASIPADNAAIAAAAARGSSEVGLARKKGGVRVDLTFTSTWTGYAGYSLERRKGARPLGAVWGNTGGTAPMEIVEPIDYETEDIFAGVQHVAGLNALNIRFTASIFKNKLDTLTFEEPYRIPPAQGVTTVPAAGAFTRGRFDLTPSNDAYNIRAEYTRSLPDFYRGYVTAVVSAGTWRQDDNLIPYTIIPNVSQANVTLLNGGNWDALTALSRPTTDATIDTRLADVTLSINPTNALNLKLRGRYYEADNQTDPFLSVNPNAVYLDADSTTAGNQTRGLSFGGYTGVWGRPLNDGSGQSLLMGTNSTVAGNIPIRSLPYSLEQHRFGGTADYRLSKAVTLNADLERDTMRRTHRDRDRTWDDRVKVGVVHRGVGEGTVRGSYEYVRRRGSEYRPTAYGEGFSPVLVAMPTAAGTNVNSWIRGNSGLRTFDLADHDQHVINGRFDLPLRKNLDAGFSGQLRDRDYPNSPYGQKHHTQRSLNLDLNYQPSPRQNIYAFVSTQFGRSRQASIAQANANVVIGQDSPLGPITPANAIAIGSAPGGPIYPLNNRWHVKSTDRNQVYGVGLHQEIGIATLAVDYSYSTGRSRVAYDYNIGGALNAANAALAGNRMPDLVLDTHFLDASLRFPLTKNLSARVLYRCQKEDIRDWHYRNVHENPVGLGNQGAAALPTVVVLDGGPEDYNANWFGVLFQLKL